MIKIISGSENDITFFIDAMLADSTVVIFYSSFTSTISSTTFTKSKFEFLFRLYAINKNLSTDVIKTTMSIILMGLLI